MSSLTDTTIRNANNSGDTTKKLRDGNGLYLYVTPSGSKLWRCRYRIDGKENTYALGEYAKESNTDAYQFSLTDARKERERARALVRQGIHPAHERKSRKATHAAEQANTFRQVADEWLSAKKPKWVSSYHAQVSSSLERYVYPEIGEKAIRNITSAEMLAVVQLIAKRGTPTIARAVRQRCGAVFRLGIVTLRCDRDPCEAIKGAIETADVQHYVPLNPDQIPILLRKLGAYGGRVETIYAIRLLLLTFVRVGELRKAEWTEIDFSKKLWRIPAEKMKNRREHLVPLSHQTAELLEELREITGHRRWVFPGVQPAQPMSTQTVTKALRYMGYRPGEFSSHGFRSTASTQLNEMGFRSDVIERQLAHTERNEIRASYNHAKYLPERKLMMQAWADFIDSLVAGKNVVPIRTQR